MVMFTSSVFDRKLLFGQIWSKKLKFSWSWNLVPRLIQIWRIQWWCSLFWFWPFLGKFGPKYQNFQFKLKFATKNNLNIQNSLVMFNFFFEWKYLFLATLVPKFKTYCLKWNFTPRLTWICRIQWWCSLFCFRPGILFLGKFCPKFKIVSLS